MAKQHLGELDELVLLATGILHNDAYAFAIKQTIKEQTRRTIALPTIHAALYRLEKRGFLESTLGGATAERGGRRKRLFSITNAGLQALAETQATREQMWRLIQAFPQPLGGIP